jgi:hypothetical protein
MACLLEQVVEVAAYQGLSRDSRVEITPWLSPIQLYRSQGENRMISPGLQRTTTLLFFLFTTMDDEDGAWRMVMGKGIGRERNGAGIPSEDHCGFATTEQGPWKDRTWVAWEINGIWYHCEHHCGFARTEQGPGTISMGVYQWKQNYHHYHSQYCRF